ncbi:hypothetical protein JDW15_04525 [Aerococcaceae bacterium zg-ZJ1578]|uniref:PepSY domain-containing protein n=1 Tax=Aerococcaceae bacterium zg-252 TaxID=2796928 RepID=UPI001A262A01|nr:hypothetical protein [Aerococcaceae bacterium zg-1578]
MSKKLISFLTILFLILLISFLALFIRTQDRIYRAEDEAIQLVSYDYEVKKVNKFYWSTLDKTYFGLDFTDKDKQQHYALIAQDGGETHYFMPNDIISEEDAKAITLNDVKPFRILQMRLSLFNDQPVWEATIKNENGTLTYYTINAKDGSWVQTIENL